QRNMDYPKSTVPASLLRHPRDAFSPLSRQPWSGPNHQGYTAAPRILIVSAAVGTGHQRAAEAIKVALCRRLPEARVRCEDVLSLATAPFRWCYAQTYLELIRRAPKIIGLIYDHIDRPVLQRSQRWYKLRVFLERLNVRPFVRLLLSEPWDLVIHTFFL